MHYFLYLRINHKTLKTLLLYLSVLIFIACERPVTQPPEAVQILPFYERANDFLARGETDSAFLEFSTAKDTYLALCDSLNVSYSLSRMAMILTAHGDYYGGQETLLQAIEYLDEYNPDHRLYLGSTFNSLGRATYRLFDYENALRFYDAALRFDDEPANTAVYLNNKARVFLETGEYEDALTLYEAVLAQTPPEGINYARSLTNMAMARGQHDPQYDALPDLMVAMRIRERAGDKEGMNASYTHLSDYFARKNHPLALHYARRRYQLARELRFGDEQVVALSRLIGLSTPDSARYYVPIYQALSDSLQRSRIIAKNRFALIRYEVEKNKSDNLRLQKENADHEHHIAQQRLWMGLRFIMAIFLAVGGIYWYRKRTERLALEADNRIKAHELRTSRKIHDVVANGLYRVMAEIENHENIDRERVLDRLENMYEQSRDISYEKADHEARLAHAYHEQVSEMLKSFATESIKIFIVGNDPENWEDIPVATRDELRHVLQEMMVNMHKHSGASRVVVRFEKAEDTFNIYYHDDGRGLPKMFKHGNGLKNTGNRIEGLNGRITFAGEPGKGLKIMISLPLPK